MRVDRSTELKLSAPGMPIFKFPDAKLLPTKSDLYEATTLDSGVVDGTWRWKQPVDDILDMDAPVCITKRHCQEDVKPIWGPKKHAVENDMNVELQPVKKCHWKADVDIEPIVATLRWSKQLASRKHQE